MSKDSTRRIAVIGDNDFTTGFRLAGVKEVHGSENYQETIQELLSRDDIGIVVAEHDDIQELPERVAKNVHESVNPVVVALSETGTTEQINEKIRKVIGADIT